MAKHPLGMTPVIDYYSNLNQFKEALFKLYMGEDLRRKTRRWNKGWTWGYRLVVENTFSSGSSIGEDEIKIFFDLPHLVNAQTTYCVGVAFGLSTFCFALAKPEMQIFAIDNYSEREGPATEYAKALVEKIISHHFPNVHLLVGTSPEDIQECLLDMPRDEKLSLIFIDGLHTDDAASADFYGARPHMDERTVVLWHNTNSVANAITECFDQTIFNRSYTLYTYGLISVFFNSQVHPSLDTYFQNCALIWVDWEGEYVDLLEAISLWTKVNRFPRLYSLMRNSFRLFRSPFKRK